jgi:hypothetical protein
MKINSKVLNLPPFISTSWDNVASLHMKGSTLAIVLANGETVLVPGLPPTTLELIFAAHAAHLESATEKKFPFPAGGSLFLQALAADDQKGELPLQFGFTSMEGFGSALQHDPNQVDAPFLPDEVLEKISAIAKIISRDEEFRFPQAHPGCNCIHCQICRAVGGEPKGEIAEEEKISDAELHFSEWDIVQKGDKLYEVTSRLEKEEKYSVYLGDPVGCTCGKQGCEHILAVLKS